MIALELMGLEVEHVFSCEIEPFKQAFIFRNFSPGVLFRDACQLGESMAEDAWGVPRSVPTKSVDVLVAGTSCVDFSALNHSKKRLRDGGQSGRTFAGMLRWVMAAKPAMVLLENVCGAPWGEMCASLENVGYTVQKTELDSKRFGLPQTRIRGYALALLGDSHGSWPSILRQLELEQDPPPLSSYLSGSLSDAVVTAKATLTAKRVGVVQPSAWIRCEHRHNQARANEGLGMGRPLTGWAPGGPPLLRTGGWAEYATRLGPRKTDLLDINFIRQAKLGRDAEHRTCVWNLRQNVNWETGHTKQEICPCLTPSMLPWVTSLGRPLIGEECLRLQGVPLGRLSLLGESNAGLMDLAGNGMTVPVVAAAIAAGLWCGHIRGSGPVSLPSSAVKWTIGAEVLSVTPRVELTADALCSMVGTHTPYCLCKPPGKPVQCSLCAHTACTRCCTSPRHSYEATSAARVEDTRVATEAFPLVVRLTVAGETRKYQQVGCAPGVRCAHAQYETFPPSESLHCTVRTNPSNTVVWRVGRLCLECGTDEPISHGRWSRRADDEDGTQATVVAPAATPRHPSWLSSLGADCTATRPGSLAFVGVGRFSGLYILAPHCGAPNNSLFVHEHGGLWFLFDPLGDRCVFATSIGYALPEAIGFCDPVLQTGLSLGDIAGLVTGGEELPFSYSHSYRPLQGPLPILEALPPPLKWYAPEVYPASGQKACGSLQVVMRWQCAGRDLPPLMGHLPSSLGTWQALAPLQDTCTQCAPLGPSGPAAMVLAWHARPTAIATDYTNGTTQLAIDPVALHHRALRTHSRGVCSFRLAAPTITATRIPADGPAPVVTLCDTPLSEARPGRMAHTKYSLRDDQRALLAWARTREEESGRFTDQFVLASRTCLGVCLQLKSEQLTSVRGGAMVDCVGYGKTIVALALVSETDIRPSLVVVPPHLVRQWQQEAATLFPGLRTKVILSKRGAPAACAAPLPPLVVTSANLLSALPAVAWRRVIVDEFSYLSDTQVEEISGLPAAPRWLLSATPGISTPGGVARIARLLGVRLGHLLCDRVAPWAAQLPSMSRGAAICESFARLVQPPGGEAIAAGQAASASFLAVALRRSRAIGMGHRCTPRLLRVHIPQGEQVSNQLALLANPRMSQATWSTQLLCHPPTPDRMGALSATLRSRIRKIEDHVCAMVTNLCRAFAHKELREWLHSLRPHPDSPDNLAARHLLSALSKTAPAVDEPTQKPTDVATTFFSLLEAQKQHAQATRALRYAARCRDNSPCSCDTCGPGEGPTTFALPCLHLLCGPCHQAKVCPVPGCRAAFAGAPVPPPPFCARTARFSPRGTGAKIAMLCDFLANELPPSQGCLVFFQGAEAGAYLEKELTDKGHSPWRIRGSPAAQFRVTEKLQRSQAKGERIVLLLEMGTQEAAGSNLTAFAHSVFVNTPYGCNGGTPADIEKQAIGRTARFGQVAHPRVHRITSGSDSPLR